jgi:hypothetical protein
LDKTTIDGLLRGSQNITRQQRATGS